MKLCQNLNVKSEEKKKERKKSNILHCHYNNDLASSVGNLTPKPFKKSAKMKMTATVGPTKVYGKHGGER